MNIIGLDCAAQNQNIGLVYANLVNGIINIKEVKVGLSDIIPILSTWVERGPCLLCIDAPLGWPMPMTTLLGSHSAGEMLHSDANTFFRRETDLCIKRVYNKNPLDIGADRIARVALSALNIIDRLRQEVGHLPLLWSPEELSSGGVIEVYPAATIISHGLNGTGYKGKEQDKVKNRRELFENLGSRTVTDVSIDYLVQKEDAFDAFICVLAGVDFIEGRSIAPSSIETARQEGWIWVKAPS
ncbi:DUF429 domain-containing protein [Alteromonas sp. W364]|uniref:DUF429 domain-containing protein n=1 Tax=Alteromonas sp. W364 TaxID=3075610 RepID=UPI002885B835|nr:DUF429 domain-containing protein [Alteromonas sp. W364]MDT0628080.1 DUF429 domain-containing protein [Alteromonas sp. W364]